MANLTAAQIKTILESAVYPEAVEINGALLQNDERRKYPSIDVQNITGDEQIKGFPTTTLGQTFLVHLFYRYRSFGEQHEPDIKALEDVIFTTIDSNATFSTDVKITITQSWRRESETFPVRRSHSILTVSAEELSATDGSGLPGDKMEITLPAPVSATFKIISLGPDEKNLQKDLDRVQTGEEVFTKIHLDGLLVVEIELDFTQETNLQTLIDAGDDVSVTLTKSGQNRVLLVNLTTMVSSASREVVQSTLLTMDVKL